jgi:cellulose synthase operon protein C
MVKVECDGCKAPYQIDEKRIPAAGLKMRCPKCGKNLLVTKLGVELPMAEADLPLPAVRPAQPPPRAAASGGGEELTDLPAPSTSRTQRGRPGFGELDFGEPDLPAATSSHPTTRLPPRGPRSGAATTPRSAIPGATGKPAARRTGGFGEIDLLVDLPAPALPSGLGDESGFGDDLEMGGRAEGEDIEVPRSLPDMAAEFGEVDLPAVHGDELDLPALPKPGAELPAVVRANRGPVKPRGRTVPFGGVLPEEDEPEPEPPPRPGGRGNAFDLPSLPETGVPGLPQRRKPPSAHDAPPVFEAAPAPRGREAPSVFEAAPAPRGREAPPVFEAAPAPPPRGMSAPAVRREAPRGFGEIDLPLIGAADLAEPHGRAQSGVSTAGLPAVATAVGMPMPASGSGLPAPAMAIGMPTATPHSGLPVVPPAYRASPSTHPAAEAYGHHAVEARRTRPSAAPPSVGEEFSFDAAPVSSRRGAFDDSDRANPAYAAPASSRRIGAPPSSRRASGLADRSAVGDEVDLSSERSGVIGDLPPLARPEPARPAATPAQTKRKKKQRRTLLATLVVVAVGGASLALEPTIGAFGVNFISDQLNAKKYAAALDALRASVQADLDEDTSTAAGHALERAKAALAAAPRSRPTAAYVAYVALARSLRFGNRGEDEALGKQLLAAAEREPSPSLSLAKSAEQAELGHYVEARQILAGMGPDALKDPDVADLAGAIELGDRSASRALAAWKQAEAARAGKKSGRVLYGLARAKLLTGEADAATMDARAVIETSPLHAGARVLLASVLRQTPEREDDAIKVLKQVTEDASIRGAASDAEVVEALTMLGGIHLARSRISAAEQAFAAALKIDPQAVKALVGNGELFYRAGRYSEASARFEAAMRVDDTLVAAKVGAAKTWLALERMKDAKDLLKKVREGSANDPAVTYWLGRVEEALGNKKEAEAAYAAAVKVNESKPEVVDAYVALSHLLSAGGRAEEANQKLLDASKRFPDSPALHRAKGDLLLQMGRYEESKDELSAALAKEEDLGTRFKLGVAYLRMHAFGDATAAFDKIASVDKDYPGLAIERGLLFAETGQSDRALEMYSAALKKAPNDVDLKLRVGSAQVMAGHPAEAEAVLRDVVKEHPNSAEANHFLGRALLARATNLAEAMRFLEFAVSIDSNRAEYYLYVGWCANEAGQTARAEIALKRALELDHDLADAYWQRGVLLQKQGATVDALAALKTALEKRPTRYEAYATMALCYQDQQSWAEAEQAWHKAIVGNGAVAEWHYRLGKLLASHGQQAAAGAELDQAITLAEAPDRPTPVWLYDAHFLFAEASRVKSRDKAIRSYQRFLELAPRGNAYIIEAQRALASLGAAPGR